MLSRGISFKRRYGSAGFALGCGCKDAKSVSVSASVSASPSPSGAGTSTTTETRRRGGTTNPSASTTTTDTLTLTSASSSSFVWEDAVAEFGCNDDELEVEGTAATQSFSGLLRELSELEQSVASWGARKSHVDKKLSATQLQEQDSVDKKLSPPPAPREHNRKVTTKSSDSSTSAKCYHAGDIVQVAAGLDLDGRVEAGFDGSVAVVKQSEDPLGDFRQSMVQMIVENGIIAGEELREMLRRFLSLNAPHHHDAILRAFAEIWDAVFFTPASSDEPALPATATAHKYARREPCPGRPPATPRTPPRHRRSPSAWRV